MHYQLCVEMGNVGLEYGCLGAGTLDLLYLGLSMPCSLCCAYYPNIMPVGCRVVAWWLCCPPCLRLLDSHAYALWP